MTDINKRLIGFNKGYLPEMVQLKYRAMSKNAFSFFRGTCHIYYEDLSGQNIPSSPLAWISGDLHIENFGSYKGDNNLVYFDLNDFDESSLAPVTFEISRMITGIFVAFKSLGFKSKKAFDMAQLFLKTYSTVLAGGKAISIEKRTATGIVQDFLAAAKKRRIKDVIKKQAIIKKNRIALSLKKECHLKLGKELKKELRDHIIDWFAGRCDGPCDYVVKGIGFRVAGTGSLGVKRYLFLLKSTKKGHKYLFIDMKQARPSSLSNYNKVSQPTWATEGERVVTIQRRVQDVSASLLSHTVFKGVSYVVQELQPMEDGIDFNLLKGKWKDIYQVIEDMAILTASGQLRSGGIEGSSIIDDLKKFGKSDNWQKDLLEYSFSYSKQVETYYQQYLLAYQQGDFKPELKQKHISGTF